MLYWGVILHLFIDIGVLLHRGRKDWRPNCYQIAFITACSFRVAKSSFSMSLNRFIACLQVSLGQRFQTVWSLVRTWSVTSLMFKVTSCQNKSRQQVIHQVSSASWSRQTFVTGLSRQLVFVLILTCRMRPLLSWTVLTTLPMIQELRGAESSTTSTMSPGTKLHLILFNFWCSWSCGKYSFVHCFQNKLDMYCICFHLRTAYKSSFWKRGKRWLFFKEKKMVGTQRL